MVASPQYDNSILHRHSWRGTDSSATNDQTNLSIYAQGLQQDSSGRNMLRNGHESAQQHLPPMQLTLAEKAAHDIVIHGKNGHEDTVAGIEPIKGETLPQLIKRLHPNLSDQQLQKEVHHMLKYNKDLGHDLGDGMHLDPSKTVYLSSVKYLDAAGHITRIEGPTGKLTEIAYDSNGVCAYKITAPDGSVAEQAARDNSGNWSLFDSNGRVRQLSEVSVDRYGDITATTQNGNKLAHLTRGDDIFTRYENDQPQVALTWRDGHTVSQYQYEYTRDKVNCYITYSDNPDQKILLEQQDSSDAGVRAAIARGELASDRTTATDTSIDLPPDSYAGRMMQAAQGMVGLHVDDVASGIPRNVGCARMVSEALMRAGFPKSITDAGCANLTANLKAHGFKEVSVSDMKAGDIIMGGYAPNDPEHTGIYAGNGTIMANSSKLGYFHADTYANVFGGFPSNTIWRYVG